MYRNTPYSTGMGMWDSNGVSSTEHPIMRKISMWVTRCSRTPINCGFSPGAAVSDSFLRELT